MNVMKSRTDSSSRRSDIGAICSATALTYTNGRRNEISRVAWNWIAAAASAADAFCHSVTGYAVLYRWLSTCSPCSSTFRCCSKRTGTGGAPSASAVERSSSFGPSVKEALIPLSVT